MGLDLKAVATFREKEEWWWMDGGLGFLDASGSCSLTWVVTWVCPLYENSLTVQVRCVHCSYLCYASIKRFLEMTCLWYCFSLFHIFTSWSRVTGLPCGEAHMAEFGSRSAEASNSHTGELPSGPLSLQTRPPPSWHLDALAKPLPDSWPTEIMRQ